MCVPAEDSGIISTSPGLGFSICNMDTVTLIVPFYRAVVKTKLVIACKRLRNHFLHTESTQEELTLLLIHPFSDSVTQGDWHS